MTIVRNVFSCPKAWATMPGDQFARTCATCSRTVYDLTRLSEAEIIRFVVAHDGKVCVRIHTDADGFVVNGACKKEGTVLGVLGEVEAVSARPRARTDREHQEAAVRRLEELDGKAPRKSWRAWDFS